MGWIPDDRPLCVERAGWGQSVGLKHNDLLSETQHQGFKQGDLHLQGPLMGDPKCGM